MTTLSRIILFEVYISTRGHQKRWTQPQSTVVHVKPGGTCPSPEPNTDSLYSNPLLQISKLRFMLLLSLEMTLVKIQTDKTRKHRRVCFHPSLEPSVSNRQDKEVSKCRVLKWVEAIQLSHSGHSQLFPGFFSYFSVYILHLPPKLLFR